MEVQYFFTTFLLFYFGPLILAGEVIKGKSECSDRDEWVPTGWVYGQTQHRRVVEESPMLFESSRVVIARAWPRRYTVPGNRTIIRIFLINTQWMAASVFCVPSLQWQGVGYGSTAQFHPFTFVIARAESPWRSTVNQRAKRQVVHVPQYTMDCCVRPLYSLLIMKRDGELMFSIFFFMH